MALAERLLNARFGDDEVVDHHTYVIAGDGCLMEGISHEARLLAGHLGLGRLIVLFDDNGISIDGPVSLSDSDDQCKRFEASRLARWPIDGHDPEAIAEALEAARQDERPSLIACRTTIGFGAPTKAGKASSHGAPLGEEEIAGAREALGWPPPALRDSRVGRRRLARGRRPRRGRGRGLGQERLEPLSDASQAASSSAPWRASCRRAGAGPGRLQEAVGEEAPEIATRVSSQKVLEILTESLPELIGGSADLTGSNNTKGAGHKVVNAEDFTGNYLHYGVREHGMAAAMNGMALHGGIVPYGGTFLVFTDYCRPSIRLSALMEQRVVYVMTHDSIGLGEDGPTHQPVEHLAALRAIPNLLVFPPCDTIETAECWELALQAEDGPSVLALTRQGLPTLRTETHGTENHSAYGAYILVPADGQRQVTLIASGSEVQIALDAQASCCAEENISAAVVSMPCWELFREQPAHYRDEVLGPGPLHIAVEAACPFGWERWIESGGGLVGMRSSAPRHPPRSCTSTSRLPPKPSSRPSRPALVTGSLRPS